MSLLYLVAIIVWTNNILNTFTIKSLTNIIAIVTFNLVLKYQNKNNNSNLLSY